MSEVIVRSDYDLQYGDRYRQAPKGDSSPLVEKWIDYEAERKAQRRKKTTPQPLPSEGRGVEGENSTQQLSVLPFNSLPVIATEETHEGLEAESSQCAVLSALQVERSEVGGLAVRDEALIKVLNEYYGPSLPPGQRHPRFTEETSHWLCWVCDNDPEKAIALSRRLDWVKDWNPKPGEVEDLCQSAAKKKLLTHCPKALKELLQKVDAEVGTADATHQGELSMDGWIAQIEQLFDVYPCMREVCEPHPKRLWPFLLFASSALMGTLMTLTYYYYYDNPEKKRRLNYNVLGIGDPASGKGALERIADLLTEPIDQADQLANDAINSWKEEQRSKGSNKDKAPKPKGIIRLHGARTSNNVFINDMVNAWTEVQGEHVQMHMLTVDTEALNSIKMQKGGSWIDREVLEIKAWSNERDNQQYANLDSVTGFFNVYWNQVRTCTPPAMRQLANERNFGSGWPTRVSAIPVPGTGFQMLELRHHSQKALDDDETLRQWARILDKRQGELPLWSLVEHAWHWANNRMEIAKFNNDKADELLLKRCPANALAIAAPWVDMRHREEYEESGSYETDEQDKTLLDLVLDIQYSTTCYYFYALAQNYFDEQTKVATKYRFRTSRFENCFRQLPDEFTTETFANVFGYANAHSAQKTLERLCHCKDIKRTMRGNYKKLVSELSTI